MALTVRRLRRIEAWSTWRAAGGTRQAVVDDAISCRVTARLEDEQATIVTPLDSPAAAYLGARKVIRIEQDDATYDEYRITDRARDEEQGRLVVTAAPLRTTDLQGAGLIQRLDSDGVIVHDFESLSLTPTEHIDNWILPALAAAGFTWIARGTITPTQRVDMTFAWDTPLAALLRLAEATRFELDIRRNGNIGYLIDLVTKVNAGAQTADVRVDKNLVNVISDENSVEQATRVFPRGAQQDELHATMARAVWQVTNVVGSVVTIADPAGGAGPIEFDNQLVGAYLRKTTGALTSVTSSSRANQTVTVASPTAIAIGDSVQFRADVAGKDLVYLEDPVAVNPAVYGIKAAVRDVPDVPATNNLVKNSVMRAWPGSSSAPPTNWTAVGAPTIAKQVAAPFTGIGGQSIKVTSTLDGQGVISDAVPIFPTTLAPYLSGFARLWVASGNARVELVITTPSGTKVFPLLPDVATPTNLGQWADVGASGYDANGVAATAAQIRVVQHGIGSAVFYVDAAQITQSATQEPFFEGSGGTRLWQEANEALRTGSNPRASYTVPLVDLEAVDPVTWNESALILGANAHIVDLALGLDIITRLVSIDRDYLNPQATSITLSTRFDDLTDLLAGQPRPPRTSPTDETPSDGSALEMRIENFREIRRTPTTVTLGWIATGPVDELWLYLLNLTPPVVSDPWADLALQPPVRLAANTTEYTVPIPRTGTITYGRLAPMGSALLPMTTTPARGRPWDFTLQPNDAIPEISLPVQLVAPSGLTVDLKFTIADPAGLGGTLKVWTNHALSGDADPTTAAEGSVAIGSTDPPFEVSAFTVFTLTGGGTSNLLDDIRVQPGRGKRVFAEFTNTQGISSGIQSIILQPTRGAVDDNNELIAGIIHDYTPFASGIAPIKIVGALPGTGEFVGQIVLLTTDSKIYRWTGSAWTSAVAAVDLTGTINTAQIADAAIIATKIGALAVIAGKIAAAAVATAELAALAVTATNIATDAVTTPKLIAGAVTAAKITAHTITANEITALTITAAEIATGAIIAAKIGAGEVTAGKIAALSIVAGDIAALTITGAKIVAGTITADKLVANSITAGQIQAGAIGTTELAALAVTAVKIAAGTITADKMNVSTLSAIVADLGTITAGIIQNLAVSPTAGLRISSGYSKPGTWSRYIDFAGTGTEPFIKHEKFELLHDGSIRMNKIVIILTSGSSWTVPADFNPFLNSVEIIGGGGGGAGGLTNTQGGGGGAGGKFSKVVAFNPGGAASIPYAIGAGGNGGSSSGGAGSNGGATSWSGGLVAAGGPGSTGPGGASGGGTSGQGGAGSVGSGSRGGGGGGGAAGPNDIGSIGSDASVGTGGTGGTGGGPNGGAGGAANLPGGAGTAWDDNPGSAQAGSGGGGGGGSTGVGGGAGGSYGGGGGGGACSAGNGGSGGNGAAGVIVITYFPIGTF